MNQARVNQTALMCAASSQFFTKTLEILLKAGADVNIRNDEGKDALLFAANYMCLDMLLEAGADVNITDNDGNTALHIEKSPKGSEAYIHKLRRYCQCVKRLLETEIRINRSNISKDKNALETLLDYEYRDFNHITEICYKRTHNAAVRSRRDTRWCSGG